MLPYGDTENVQLLYQSLNTISEPKTTTTRVHLTFFIEFKFLLLIEDLKQGTLITNAIRMILCCACT